MKRINLTLYFLFGDKNLKKNIELEKLEKIRYIKYPLGIPTDKVQLKILLLIEKKGIAFSS